MEEEAGLKGSPESPKWPVQGIHFKLDRNSEHDYSLIKPYWALSGSVFRFHVVCSMRLVASILFRAPSSWSQ